MYAACTSSHSTTGGTNGLIKRFHCKGFAVRNEYMRHPHRPGGGGEARRAACQVSLKLERVKHQPLCSGHRRSELGECDGPHAWVAAPIWPCLHRAVGDVNHVEWPGPRQFQCRCRCRRRPHAATAPAGRPRLPWQYAASALCCLHGADVARCLRCVGRHVWSRCWVQSQLCM